MTLFEVYLAPGHHASQLISQELLDDTGARIFSDQEAELVGFEGIPANESGDPRVFVACKSEDERLIQARVDSSPASARFRVHQV
jgi:hypothetical protein